MSTNRMTQRQTSSAVGGGLVVKVNFPATRGSATLRTSYGLTVAAFIQGDLSGKIKDQNLAPPSLDQVKFVTEEHIQVAVTDVLSEHPYTKSCLASNRIPIFHYILQSSTTPVSAAPVAPQNFVGATMTARNFHTGISNAISVSEFPLQVLLPNGQSIVVTCENEWSLEQLKSCVAQVAAKKYPMKDFSRFFFKTPEGLLGNEEIVSSLPFVQKAREQSITPQVIMIEKAAALTKKQKETNVAIGALIGSPLAWQQEDSETSQCRKGMKWVRYSEKKLKKQQQEIGSQEVPKAEAIPEQNLMIKLGLPLLNQSMIKTVLVSSNANVGQYTKTLVEKHYKNEGTNKRFGLKKLSSSSGVIEFIEENQVFGMDSYIRECAEQKAQPQLSLVEVPNETVFDEEFDEDVEDDGHISFDHEEIRSDNKPWDQLSHISLWELNRQFRIKIVGVENLRTAVPLDNIGSMYMTAQLYHGGSPLGEPMTTTAVGSNLNPRWYEWLTTNVELRNIPRATRVCVTLWSRLIKKDELGNKEFPLGWANIQLFGYKHELKSGLAAINMWPDDKANPIGTCVGNSNPLSSTFYIEFESYNLPVVFPTEPMVMPDEAQPTRSSNTLSVKIGKPLTFTELEKKIKEVISRDPLYVMTAEERQLLWDNRDYCLSNPNSLPKFLQSVNYGDRLAVQIMHRLLEKWPRLQPQFALELLDSRYADAHVRNYAVSCLEDFPDEFLGSYLLQLVQVLKYEPYHDSPLARFLVRRALRSRKIGHNFFWFLKAEMHVSEISERFGLLLEAYLRGCGSQREELGRERNMVSELVRIANSIKTINDKERKDVLHKQLNNMQWNSKIGLPLNPSIEVNGLKVEKCKYMDSKKLPLWLVFQNADIRQAPKYIIFKSGDDLRQDMLTLQMLQLMDKLWKADNLDLEMNAYGCISTGDEEGMIEVVLNADTMANITKNAGGATAAFRADPLANWLRQHNPSEQEYKRAVDKFVLSCAGYCVATFVLGIGDRHNDNVMLTKDGRLFHIDFGHFLGNFKKKFGFKRERAPFVFTPDMAFVMGGRESSKFKDFLAISSKAYNVLRKHANLFINLFAMMLSTGIPELTSVEDIYYLRDAFALDMDEQSAALKWTNTVYESLATKTTQLNNAIHIWAH